RRGRIGRKFAVPRGSSQFRTEARTPAPGSFSAQGKLFSFWRPFTDLSIFIQQFVTSRPGKSVTMINVTIGEKNLDFVLRRDRDADTKSFGHGRGARAGRPARGVRR